MMKFIVCRALAIALLDSVMAVCERERICANFFEVFDFRNKEIRAFSASGRVSNGNFFMICKSNIILNQDILIDIFF